MRRHGCTTTVLLYRGLRIKSHASPKRHSLTRPSVEFRSVKTRSLGMILCPPPPLCSRHGLSMATSVLVAEVVYAISCWVYRWVELIAVCRRPSRSYSCHQSCRPTGCSIPRGSFRNRSIPFACVARLNGTNLLPPRGSCLASKREACGPL